MAGELIVADKQVQLRDWLGGAGTAYDWIDEVLGWWDATPTRTYDTARSASDGVRGGLDLLDKATLTGQMFISGSSQADLLAKINAIKAAWAPVTDGVNIPIVVQLLGTKFRRNGRPRRLAVQSKLTTYFEAFSQFGAIATFQFDALDPYVYADALSTVGISLPALGAGFSPPFLVPFTLPASTSSGIGSAPNNGNAPATWTAMLTGPLTNPSITKQSTGESLLLNSNGGLVIAAGDFVTMDSAEQSILYNGIGDRRAFLNLGSQWFKLDVGANSIAFGADTGSGSLTLNWRDTFQP